MSSEQTGQEVKKSKHHKSKAEPKENKESLPEKEENKEEENEEKETQSKFNFLEISKYSATSDGLNDESSFRNIIFIGSKNSGKSSLINSIISCDTSSYGRGDTSSYGPTQGINYNYLKLPNKKKIINFYEIGGGIESFDLLKEILLPQQIQNSLLFIVLDFARPKSVIEYLNNYLQEINKYIDYIKSYESGGIKGSDEITEILNKKIELMPNKQPERNMNIIPLKIYLIGNKYDILEKVNAEELKWACRSLRFYAFANGINLIYSSISKKTTIKNLYNTIINFASTNEEGLKMKSEQMVDKNDVNPLYVHYYNDNNSEIGDPKVMKGGKGNMLGLWEDTYNTLFKTFKEENINEGSNDINFEEQWWEDYKEVKLDNEVKLFQKNRAKKGLSNPKSNSGISKKTQKSKAQQPKIEKETVKDNSKSKKENKPLIEDPDDDGYEI
ncbi:MAG: GTPase domain-containing protein [archaeon]|nr:GTPase domain-containing protein [archaeon]